MSEMKKNREKDKRKMLSGVRKGGEGVREKEEGGMMNIIGKKKGNEKGRKRG